MTLDPEWRPRPRVLAHPADFQGCGEYRIVAPMRALHDRGAIQGYVAGHFQTVPGLMRMQPDAVVFQRQYLPLSIETLEYHYVRHSKAFRVYEVDDLITNLPVGSRHKAHFDTLKDMQKTFRKAVSLCNRLVVPTDQLAEDYRGLADEVVVVANYLERAVWDRYQPERSAGARPRVGWAGSLSHDGDLAIVVDVVKATAGEVDWVFLGSCPDAIRELVAEYHPGVPLAQYPAKLASLNLDLAIAPLEDVPFNRAKSHLKLLEYGVLGYPVIASDITPYRGDYPITRVANRHKAWTDAIREHLADRDELARRGDALREYVRAHWMLEDHLDVWLKAWLPA
jgi:glycosyltransferase involved in cell wall biosynthesis